MFDTNFLGNNKELHESGINYLLVWLLDSSYRDVSGAILNEADPRWITEPII